MSRYCLYNPFVVCTLHHQCKQVEKMSYHHTLEVIPKHYQKMVAPKDYCLHVLKDLPSNSMKNANPKNNQSLVRLFVLQSSDQTQMTTVNVLSTADLHAIYFQLRQILRMSNSHLICIDEHYGYADEQATV
ncbi:hypothetical protein V6N12_058582 [Hibiscus sabdariffa]|uniref:Uncharacterized protein n=1 Tax=Hibiscus sabdariffa TaxID=183260 RepID=A0ABR2EWL7_9ROSI